MTTASNVVVLGWGSLIPTPAFRDDAPLATHGVRPGLIDEGGSWRTDGPSLPLELARTAVAPRSNTPYPSWVITPGAPRSCALYAPLELPRTDAVDFARAMDVAARALAIREGVDDGHIGRWPSNGSYAEADVIASWAQRRGISGVVWTALAPKWLDEDRVPTESDVLSLLRDLIRKDEAGHAEHYVRTTPAQITSPFRAAIERDLGWYVSI